MKKTTIILLSSLLFIILILPAILAIVTPEQRESYNLCNDDCRLERKNSTGLCKTDYSECKNECAGNSTNRTCFSECRKESTNCIKQSNDNYKSCHKSCQAIILPKCEYNNHTYNAGENFTQGCDVCECKRNGQISCKKQAFCNKMPLVDENLCTESGGLHYGLCNGPYFGIFCSREKFCLCEGNNNYTCPENYECLKDFNSPNNRNTINNGWKNLLGKKLGDIGVCVQ